jgi:metal-dependent amidase/aminoacylase/carboxypeptidase family protein
MNRMMEDQNALTGEQCPCAAHEPDRPGGSWHRHWWTSSSAVRRDIHRHPEMAFDEHRTQLVAEQLRGWGYQVTTGLGGTGVVGQLVRGTAASAHRLRADMDALPIVEATGCPGAAATTA